jgi:hypothetical protein
MRLYLWRHPVAFTVIGSLFAVDVVWHIFGLHEPVLNIILKGVSK